MAPPRIILLGAAGQLGRSFRHIWETEDDQSLADILFFDRVRLDLLDASALRDAVQSLQPEIVINMAGLSDVEKAEADELLATQTNFHAVANLAAQCSSIDARLIHISSVEVFDGRQTTPYTPDDPMNPLNHYGASMMMGEEALRHESPFHVILRTSTLFGPFGNNVLTETIRAIETQDTLSASAAQTTSPTPSLDVARAVLVIVKALLSGKVDGFGTYHYAGAPPCSQADLAQAILETYAPHTDRRPTLVTEQGRESKGGIRRPLMTALNSDKIQRVYGLSAPDWRKGLREAITLLSRKK